MKINEVEALVGITKKNIRFYEDAGLLFPRRNSENGYRDYGDADVEILRRIKLLRKLGFPRKRFDRCKAAATPWGTVCAATWYRCNGNKKIWRRPPDSAKS